MSAQQIAVRISRESGKKSDQQDLIEEMDSDRRGDQASGVDLHSWPSRRVANQYLVGSNGQQGDKSQFGHFGFPGSEKNTVALVARLAGAI
jgi:hypothetical protein